MEKYVIARVYTYGEFNKKNTYLALKNINDLINN